MKIQTQFKNIGNIVGTNTMRFSEESNAMNAALELLETHASGAPVFDRTGDYVGYISETNLLDQIIAGKDLNRLMIKDVMSSEHYALDKSSSIEGAIKFLRDKHLKSIPVLDDHDVIKTVTCHDLLRVSLGVGLGVEQ